LEKKLIYAKIMLGLLAGVGLISCGAIPDVGQQSQPTGAVAQPERGAATKTLVCVLQPNDAVNGQEKYPGSGADLGARVLQSVKQAGLPAALLRGDASTACQGSGATHVLQTVVGRYEDNYTGYSGNPDRIELQLRLSLLGQPASVKEVSYAASSNLVASAFLEWGNAKPLSLLKTDFDDRVKSLLLGIR
jgi:hypothetical protein